MNFGNTIDLTTHVGELLFLDWIDGSGDVAAVSMAYIPRLIKGTDNTMSGITTTKVDWTRHDVVLLTNAVLDADAGSFGDGGKVTIGDLEIYPGATLKITSGELTTTNLTLRNGWSRADGRKKYDVARLHIGSASLKHTTANLDWYIDYDQYYPIAVSFPVDTNTIRYLNTNEKITIGPSGAIRLRYYDGLSRATNVQAGVAEGANWKEYGASGNKVVPATLEPSKGYAMTARRPSNGDAFSIVRMPLKFTDAWTTNGEMGNIGDNHKDTVGVTAYGTTSTPEYAKGWNFIGNPYMAVYCGALGSIEYATIPDVTFTEFDQLPFNTASLKPASGFYVQASTTETVTFGTGNRQLSKPGYRKEVQTNDVPVQKAYIDLSDENASDMMGLLVGEDYTAEYEPNADLSKVLGSSNSLRTYMYYGDMNMAYVAINETLAKEWIPVIVRIPATGEYTFSLNNASIIDHLENVYLIDNQEGITTNLIEKDYTFESEAGTINERFAINAKVGERQTPTDIDAVSGGDIDAEKPIKFLYQEKVYILYRGMIYDSTGKRVKEINK